MRRFSHSWVSCNQQCAHVSPCCGVVCSKKCATAHEHTCNCVEESFVPLQRLLTFPSDDDIEIKKALTQEERAIATRKEWMKFANGGAKQVDAALAILADAEDPFAEGVQEAMELVDDRFIPRGLKAKIALLDVESDNKSTKAPQAPQMDVVEGHLLD